MKRIIPKNNIQPVVEKGLCTGCGFCAGICPTGAIGFSWDDFGDYVPKVSQEKCINCQKCLKICPGKEVNFGQFGKTLSQDSNFADKVFLIRTKDKTAYSAASSGGGVRSLASFLLEKKLVSGVLMIGENKKIAFPFFAPSVIYLKPGEIRKSGARSRYLPAPLGTILSQVDKSKRYLLVGLPCQIHALRKLQQTDPQWQKIIPYAFGLLCGGTPTIRGTEYLLKSWGIDLKEAESIDYRGGDFPGGVYVTLKDGTKVKVKAAGRSSKSLKETLVGEVFMSNFFLRRRCLSCLDYLNNFSDIAFGDPWIKSWRQKSEGVTVAFLRTKKGKEIFKKAFSANQIEIIAQVDQDEISEIVKHQEERWQSFEGLKKFGHSFNLRVPIYQGIKSQGSFDILGFRGLINILSAQLGKKRSFWWLLKYIQFFRIAFRVLRRRLNIRLLLGLAILAFTVFYLFKNNSLVLNLFSISPYYLLSLGLVWSLIYLIRGYRTKIFLKIFNIETNFKEWFGTTVIASMSNYLLPQSGIVTKGGYFKFRKKMALTSFLSAHSAEVFLTFLTKGLIGLGIVYFLPLSYKEKLILAGIFSAFLLVGFLPLLFRNFQTKSQKFWAQKIFELVLGWRLISRARRRTLLLVISSIIESLLYAAWYFFAFWGLGVEISFLNALILGLLMSILMVIPITPGNLGIQEILVATFSKVGGIGFNEGLAASLLLRGVSIAMSFFLGLIFSRILLSEEKS